MVFLDLTRERLTTVDPFYKIIYGSFISVGPEKYISRIFPDDLIMLNQWVLWRLVKRGERMTKVPLQTDGTSAKTSDPATWSTCQNVMKTFVADTGFDGIGFVFSADDPYVGIDLDKCCDPTNGEVEQWAQDILDQVPTYAELSPSGKGYHLIGKAKLPETGRRNGQIEIYESGRYFTVTGHRCSPDGIGAEDIQVALLQLHANTFGAEPTKRLKTCSSAATCAPVAPVAPKLDDQSIINAILGSDDAEFFQQLQAGDWQTLKYPSQCEGDLALE